jgi:hypothetical protein
MGFHQSKQVREAMRYMRVHRYVIYNHNGTYDCNLCSAQYIDTEKIVNHVQYAHMPQWQEARLHAKAVTQ